MVENRSYRKSQSRFNEAPRTAGFSVFDFERRLSRMELCVLGFTSTSFCVVVCILKSGICVCTLISTSGDKLFSGVLTEHSEGVPVTESFSGELAREASEPESVL